MRETDRHAGVKKIGLWFGQLVVSFPPKREQQNKWGFGER